MAHLQCSTCECHGLLSTHAYHDCCLLITDAELPLYRRRDYRTQEDTGFFYPVPKYPRPPPGLQGAQGPPGVNGTDGKQGPAGPGRTRSQHVV